jgi:hypothetical protein
MKFVFALIALFAVSALAQPYAVTSVYSDSACQNTVGQYITSPDVDCANITCEQFGTSGHFRSLDCNVDALPSFPTGWVAVSNSEADTTCQAPVTWIAGVPNTCFIYLNATIGFIASSLTPCAGNSTWASVAIVDGAAAPVCNAQGTSESMNITNVCTLSESTIAAGNYLLIQCDAEEAPVATPTAEPTAPTAVPTTTPTTTPTARPVATPSNSASALAAGGLFFVVALFL